MSVYTFNKMYGKINRGIVDSAMLSFPFNKYTRRKGLYLFF